MVARTSRRGLIAALGAGGLALAGCRAPSSTSDPRPSTSSVPSSSTDPFGAAPNSSVECWIDDSRLPRAWADDLATAAQGAPVPLRLEVNTTATLAAALTGRFTADNPPDLIHDGGADQLGWSPLAPQLDDLSAVLDQPISPTGPTIRRSLGEKALAPYTLGGRVLAVPMAQVVHGLWFSAPLFQANHWQPPATMGQLLALGAQAKAQKRYLFCWGRDTATALQRMALSSAVKQGGEGVRRALDGLQPGCWSLPSIQAALKAVQRMVDQGYIKPGGSNTSWRRQLGLWSEEGQVLLAAGGSWLISQAHPAAGFGLQLVADPALDARPALGMAALHAQAGEELLVPAHGANAAGGRELVRLALQARTAAAWSQRTQMLSSLAGVDAAGGSALLTRQRQLVAAAGGAAFGWHFVDAYQANHDHQALWNGFLEGRMDVATLTRESQRITDLLRADPALVKYRAG